MRQTRIIQPEISGGSIGGGTYLITLYLRRRVEIEIGSLGRKRLARGYYVYVGSARRGLLSRIRRHAARSKTLRWHIDYLTTKREASLMSIAILGLVNAECLVANQIGRRAEVRIEHFGSSDCRCPSHLFYFSSRKALRRVLPLKVSERLGET